MWMMRMVRLAVIAALALVPATAVDAQSTDYPNRPIKMIVGFAAGGGTDVVARIMAQKMSEILGQPIVVENRTGASGMIAAQDVANWHRADGSFAARARSQSFVRRPFGRRCDCNGEGRSRQNQFRHRRARHDAPHDCRTIPT